ncbi:MAG: metallophosphoesterase [Firmicutes bacterium]|nr:metallophosphoesterase [Candidatus Colivicinus equi]
MKKRILTLLLTTLLLAFLSVSTFASSINIADNTNVDTIAFTSDTHNIGGNVSANRLSSWITSVATKEGDMIDTMAGLGDYAGYKSYFKDYWDRVKPVFDAVDESPYVGRSVFVAGNHDWLNGNLMLSLNSTAKRIEKKRGKVIDGDSYKIYCFGASSTFELFDSASISGLESFLKKTDNSKPIFIISHYPLHKTSERSMTNANKVVNILNKYSKERNLNIFFIWGHNHSDASSTEKNYDKVFTESIPSRGGDISINFTYAAGGCMCDEEYTSGGKYVLGKGLVASINKATKEVTLKYYDKDGNQLTQETVQPKQIKTNKKYK